MKITKLLLPLFLSLYTTTIIAQQQNENNLSEKSNGSLPNHRKCGSPVPSGEWDEWFNQQVEKYKSDLAVSKISSTQTYTVAIVFHIIYGSEPIGTYPNISQAQVASQVPILNADYAGIGNNHNLYANMTLNGHPAFYDYAQDQNLPAPDNNGVIIANTGITFCPAIKDPNGNTLTEPGVDRISYIAKGWTNPATPSTENAFTNLMDGTIKPASIWDPTKYFNVWVSDCDWNVGLYGYSTFPGGTTLNGLNNNNGTSSDDGCWLIANTVGNVGTLDPQFNLGHMLTHESGHFFGLRHIWADGNCNNDFCKDTPPAKQENLGVITAYPFHVGTCTGNTNNSTDGEMYMNFMDYTDDVSIWMFTTDQAERMHTALTQSPNRLGLSNASVSECATATSVMPYNPLDNSVSIYPNPSNGLFSMSSAVYATSELKISIVNLLGQPVYQTTEYMAEGTTTFDLSSLDKGIYFATITDRNNNKTVKKIIIQ